MKHTMHSLLFAALLPAALPAQDVVSQLVPPGSRFVCHVDVAGLIDLVGRDLVRTGFAQRIQAEAGEVDWLAKLTKEWGFDPFVDLKGVLLFGERPDGDATLALLTSARIDRVLESLTELGALETVERGGTELHQLVPQKLAAALKIEGGEGETGGGGSAWLYVHRIGGERATCALVFGSDAGKVAEAGRAMQRGGAEGRRGAREPQARIPAGCLVSVVVDGALGDLVGENPASKLTSKAQRLAIQLSHQDETLKLTVRIETGAEKDARQIAAVVNGLKALASLADPEDLDLPEGLMEVVQEAQAKAEGKSVTFEVTVPGDLVQEGLRELRQELGEEPPAPARKGKQKPKQPARQSVIR